MKRIRKNPVLIFIQQFIFFAVLIFFNQFKSATEKSNINESEFRDRAYTCWLGKNIGGTLGMPFEGKTDLNNINFYTNLKEGEHDGLLNLSPLGKCDVTLSFNASRGATNAKFVAEIKDSDKSLGLQLGAIIK
jgi:hypothetical protein